MITLHTLQFNFRIHYSYSYIEIQYHSWFSYRLQISSLIDLSYYVTVIMRLK